MTNFRRRIVIPIAILIFITLGLLGALMGPLINGFYMDKLTDRIKKETEVVSLYLHDTSMENLSGLQNGVDKLADRLNIRITVIDIEGEVIAETHDDPLDMENHLQREEIKEAIQTGEGQEIRYSETLNLELLYYAIPFEIGEEQTAYLRLAMPVQEVTSVYKNIMAIIIAGFVLAFIVIVFLATKITNQITYPIEDAQKVAKQLAKGDFSARTFEPVDRGAGELNRSINVLAENLEKITKTYETQQERLETLIENMGSGLLFINEKGHITLVNRSFKEIFQEDTDLWLDQLYYDVIRHKKVVSFVQKILLTEEKQRKQIKLPMNIEIRHFDVYGAPIIGSDHKRNGAVLVFHDITELKKLEQTRKDFVANVSHELKTPVTSLKGFTETLLAGAMEDPEITERFITIIANESKRLENLIHDLLELSKIEGAHFELQYEKVDLEILIDEVFVMLEEKASLKGIQLKKKISGDSIIDGDSLRIKQILINLVNNGIMYTPELGEIKVRVREQAENLVLEVEDTGIGMSKEELPRIFERFYRVDRARSRNSGGTGLGLAIVKHIAEAHQIDLTVDSVKGQGTIFRLIFKKNIKQGHEEESIN